MFLAAIIQKNTNKKIKTFTIGFKDGNNEAPFAKETARFLGTDHTEFICTTQEAQEIIPDLAYYYDEPFADDSAIPTMLVSRLIKDKVKVALFADGGDHIFTGRAVSFKNNLKLLNLFPDVMKGPARPVLNLISNLTPASNPQTKHKIRTIARSLNQNQLLQAGNLFRNSYSFPSFYLQNFFRDQHQKLSTPLDGDTRGFPDAIEMASAFEFKMHLQDCILTKVEHANMSASLNGREPILDHRLVEFAAQLPLSYKFDGTAGKLILKDIVHDYVPKEIMDRPKVGFTPPVYTWLRGDLRYLIDEYLNDKAIAESGLFNNSYITKLVELYNKQKLYYSTFIWRLLMFQMWYFRWMRE